MSDKLFKGLIVGIVAVVLICVGVVVAVNLSSSNKGSSTNSTQQAEDPGKKVDATKLQVLDANKIWNKGAFMGNESAQHKLVVYGDLFCPYCRKAYEAIQQNLDDFKNNYITPNKLSYEVRVTDLLSTPSDPIENYNSTTGGEVVHCAMVQDKFWDYYTAIEDKIYNDYYVKGLGDRHYDRNGGDPDWKEHQLPKLETSYFTDVAKTVPGIDIDKMNKCIQDGTGMKSLKQYSKSASKAGATSFPSFFVDGKQSKELYNINNTYDYASFYSGIKKGLAVKNVL
ncbi:MAG: DsbA family protein [Candidatus Ancillula sp.]|jgi:protein-disulfide isomerase|nr:DsbA family protein [Candidatus Ancillula sp.]